MEREMCAQWGVSAFVYHINLFQFISTCLYVNRAVHFAILTLTSLTRVPAREGLCIFTTGTTL